MIKTEQKDMITFSLITILFALFRSTTLQSFKIY